jgi:Bacterial antitoxin of type II TA system, VapB
MRTNIDLNDDLVIEAMRVTGARTKREVVERALAELVARSKRPSIGNLLGVGGLDPTYNHKIARGADAWHRVEEPRATYRVTTAVKRSTPKSDQTVDTLRRKASAKAVRK